MPAEVIGRVRRLGHLADDAEAVASEIVANAVEASQCKGPPPYLDGGRMPVIWLRAYLSAEHDKAHQWPEHEKARLWDELTAAITRPGLRDTWVQQVSAMRRAVSLLLDHREELPPALARELDSYTATLDALHLEGADGFADAQGVLNLLPTYIIISLMGGITREHETR